jgi:DNA polymerase
MSLKKAIEFLVETLGEIEIPAGELKTKEDKIREVYEEASRCKKCPLWRGRKKMVFGHGNPYSRVLFVGEAPGEDEDRIGIPFVGRAGSKLAQIMLKYGIKRENIYITNTLKCRPPSNRDPKPEELQECFKYLKKQIEIISPAIILCLGRYASLVILGEKRGISYLRQGEFYRFGARIFVTYHPSAILRKPNLTPLFEEDIERVSKLILK